MIERSEFKGNVAISCSEKEVRLWVCNDEGVNVFRFKFIGNVYSYKLHDGHQDIIVLTNGKQ